MADTNANARLEAFCDGVFAFALTLLIVDVKLSATETIGGTAELWRALRHLTPSVFAFLSSFVIILITWVNHHGALKLVNKSSAPFIYANGFLLLTVVFIPFPTSLLGDFLVTDHAGPAVVLYDGLLAVQAAAWILVFRAALHGQLGTDERSNSAMRGTMRNGYFAVALYALLAVAALWIPLTIAIITAASWLFWLALGLRLKHA